MALTPLSIDMYLPAFPFIEIDLKGTASLVQLSISIFFAGVTLGQLFYGPISDKIGRKKPLIAGLLIFLLAGVGCTYTKSIGMFIFFRFAQAIGASAGMVISQVIVTDLYTDHRKSGQVFSVLMLVLGTAPIIAPTIGSFLLDSLGWRGIFAVLLGAGALVLISFVIGIPETSKPGPDASMADSFKAYGKVLKFPGFLRISLARNIMNAGMFAYVTTSPFIFMKMYGLNEFQYGLVFAGTAVSIMLGNILSGILLKKTAPEKLFDVSNVLALIFGVLTVAVSFTKPAMIVLLLPIIGYMFNLGLMLPGSTSLALRGHGKNTGAASAINGSIQFITAFGASGIMSAFSGLSLLPMAFGVGICGVASSAIYFIAAGKKKTA